MSAPSLTERPIFASEENEYLTPERPPVSRLAIVSFIGGLFSLIALFNINLIAICFLAVTLALATYLFIAGNKSIGGQNLALAGLALGIISGVCSYTSTNLRDDYLYASAKNMAVDFANVVAQNKLLEAYELTRPEPERQVAGTSLEEAYKLMPELSRDGIDAFKKQPAIQRIADLGQDAKWSFHGGVQVYRLEGTAMRVGVQLINEKGGDKVDVVMTRSYHAGIGAWHVTSISLP